MEYWDVYDADRRKTGRIKARGEEPAEGEYQLAVIAWLRNGEGKWLVTRRDAAKKSYPLVWETPGGCAMAGEDSITAIMREIREETGVVLRPEDGRLLRSYKRGPKPSWENPGFLDVWVFDADVPAKQIRLRLGETCAASWETREGIMRLIESGQFTPTKEYPHYIDLFREYP